MLSFRRFHRVISFDKLQHVTRYTHDFLFKTKYSDDDENKILLVLNESDKNELAKYDITQSRIKNLEIWRSKNGEFKTLHQVLEVDGLGEKVLEKLCHSIINNITTVKQQKHRKQVVTPNLDSNLADSLDNVVAINLHLTGVSWAKLVRDSNALDSWNYESLVSLPTKLLPQDIFDVCTTLLKRLPIGDIYVFEATPNMSPQNNKPLTTYSQQLELSSMLLALLNMRNYDINAPNIDDGTSHCQAFIIDSLDNRSTLTIPLCPISTIRTSTMTSIICISVVFLFVAYGSAFLLTYPRSNSTCKEWRLFKTLLGNERITSTEKITKIINNTEEFPCSPVKVSQELRHYYDQQKGVNKDLLGQALLLAMTFMDLCVYKNEASYSALTPSRRSKEL